MTTRSYSHRLHRRYNDDSDFQNSMSAFFEMLTWISLFFQSHRMRLSNTPLDAELYVFFRFHNADADLVTYHAIIHEIQLDF